MGIKKLLAIIVLGLLWSENIFAKTGKGDLILDTYDLEKFIQYILGAGNEKRATSTGTGLLFVVSPSGGSTWWYCMAKSANNCKTPIDRKVEMHCEKNYSAGIAFCDKFS